MISVMNEFEIDRTSAPDLSFFGMESPKGEEKMNPIDPEIHPSLDLPLGSQDIEEARIRVSPTRNNQQHPRSPPMVSEPNEALLDMNGFVTGDMVWGKVKSHPWWPGHIFNEYFASPSVRRTKKDDFVLVAFFGDSSYGWFDPAELIPYEPTFVEKSKQTTLRSFVKAVEESIDESSRRAVLGLSCRCRNPYNFRPTKVLNYFEVDVVGYERNGIYSKRQINNERDSFDPQNALGFLHQLAVTPRGTETKDVEWYRSVAVALAVRRLRYEEFDETYAQAFGQQPVRPARDEMGVPQQAENFTPRVVPLSGPLRIAEALGGRRKSASNPLSSSTSSSGHKEKDKSSKKNKYLLKRRDERPTAASSSPLPDACFIKKQQHPPSFVLTDSPVDSLASPSPSDYVLQKREPIEDTKAGLSTEHKPNAESPQTPPMPAISGNNVDERPAPAAVLPVNGIAVKKEKKIKKRSLEEVNNQEESKMKKKKKKHRDGFGRDIPPVLKKTALKPPLESEASLAPENSIPSPRPVSQPIVDLGPLDQLELPSVVADLTALALDPFYGIERNAPLVTRHVFLRFRSLVYSKSLVVPVPGESDAQAQEVQASKPATASLATPSSSKEAKAQQQQRRDQGFLSKPTKLVKGFEEPTKSGRRRAPSDRQEEMSAKRLKKLSQLKSLAIEKKVAASAQKTSDVPIGNNGTVTATAVTPGPLAVEAVKKPEKKQPPLPNRESPTLLIMKFPPRSTLPSVANLKARFARFGPLEVDSTRVFWKSHSCRVQFKYKCDAQKALSYVKSNEIFGQIQVDYNIRELEAPASESASEPPTRRLELQGDGNLPFSLGNGSGSLSGAQLRTGLQQPQQGRLKSILKKPGDDAGKESQRVKFMLSVNGNSSSKADSPPSACGGGANFANVVPPQPPSLKPTSFQLPLPPPPQSRQTLPHPSLHPARSYPPPPPAPARPPPTQFSEVQRQSGQMQQRGGEMEGGNGSNVDISHQMLSLLLQCNDIVAGLRALPGFMPYRPL